MAGKSPSGSAKRASGHAHEASPSPSATRTPGGGSTRCWRRACRGCRGGRRACCWTSAACSSTGGGSRSPGDRRARARRSSPWSAARWRVRRESPGERRAPRTSASCRPTPSCSRTRRSWSCRQAGGPAGGADAGERSQQPGLVAGAPARKRAAHSGGPPDRPRDQRPHRFRQVGRAPTASSPSGSARTTSSAPTWPRSPAPSRTGCGRIDKPVGGRPAVTHVGVRERFGARATLLDCRLETGRTHQIRLHVLAVGHPVIGDGRYGAPFRAAPAPRMALHATTLGFAHPRSGAPLAFTSPWPPDLAAWLELLRALPP